MSAGLSWRIAALLTIPPLMWAGNAIVGRLAVGYVPPLALNGLRWLVAALILLPLGWRVLRDVPALRRHWRHLSLLGLLGVGMYNALQYMALQTSTPINVTLIAASSPVWMLAVGSLFYGQHPTVRELIGAVLSLVGVACVIARGDWQLLLALRFVTGDLLVLMAIVAWAFYSWMLIRPPASFADAPRWGWTELLLAQVLFGLIWAGGAAGVEYAVTDARIVWNGWVVAALIYIAIGPSILSFRCWSLGVSAAGPAMAAFFSNLTPVFAAVLSVTLLGETPRWYHGLSFALILAGIVVSMRRRETASADA